MVEMRKILKARTHKYDRENREQQKQSNAVERKQQEERERAFASKHSHSHSHSSHSTPSVPTFSSNVATPVRRNQPLEHDDNVSVRGEGL